MKKNLIKSLGLNPKFNRLSVEKQYEELERVEKELLAVDDTDWNTYDVVAHELYKRQVVEDLRKERINTFEIKTNGTAIISKRKPIAYLKYLCHWVQANMTIY